MVRRHLRRAEDDASWQTKRKPSPERGPVLCVVRKSVLYLPPVFLELEERFFCASCL